LASRLPLASRIPDRMPSQLIFVFQCEKNTFQSGSTTTSLLLLLWRCTRVMARTLRFCTSCLLIFHMFFPSRPFFYSPLLTVVHSVFLRTPLSKTSNLRLISHLHISLVLHHNILICTLELHRRHLVVLSMLLPLLACLPHCSDLLVFS
jgi:hypothetical protein